MNSKTFKTAIVRNGSMCFIPVPFDPKPVFGKIRAPVKVTLNGYTYRSTIASMGGTVCKPPADFAKALKAQPPAWERWRELSFTHQREFIESIEEAKKPDTRARRIDGAVGMIKARRAKKRG